MGDGSGNTKTDMQLSCQSACENEFYGNEVEGNKYFTVQWFSEWEGYGCIASQDIDQHTLIHVEFPLLRGQQISIALKRHTNGQHTSKQDDIKYLQTECGMTDGDIEQLWSLHDQYTSNLNEKRLQGIIMSNSFEDEENNYQRRLYLNTSRFNHSCAPNIGFNFDDWNIRLYTTRDIKAGETMCLFYSDVIYHFPQEKRQQYLYGHMKFNCACSACFPCTEDPARRKEIIRKSDKNRTRLKEIARELSRRVKP
eukprot:10893798-Ditylum_brightwellii.AAC.1